MKRINLKGTARNFQQNFATAYSKIGQKHDWVCAGKHDGKSEEAHGTLCLRCKATLVGVWEESKERLRSHLLSQYRIPIEKAMAPDSSTLAWKIPWMEEPGRLQSMGSRRVGHDWATSLSLFTFMHWRRKWQPTPVFLPGESQGRRSLVVYHLWGCTEWAMTEAT